MHLIFARLKDNRIICHSASFSDWIHFGAHQLRATVFVRKSRCKSSEARQNKLFPYAPKVNRLEYFVILFSSARSGVGKLGHFRAPNPLTIVQKRAFQQVQLAISLLKFPLLYNCQRSRSLKVAQFAHPAQRFTEKAKSSSEGL